MPAELVEGNMLAISLSLTAGFEESLPGTMSVWQAWWQPTLGSVLEIDEVDV